MSSDADFKVRIAEPLSFHEYARRVCVPGASYMLAKRSQGGVWQACRRPFGRIVLQSGVARGAIITDGVSQPDVFVFYLRNAGPSQLLSLNGEALGANQIAVFPPAKEFAFASRGPHEWMSLSVPYQLLAEASFPLTEIRLLEETALPYPVRNGAALLQFTATVTDALRWSATSGVGVPDGMEQTLLTDLSAVFVRRDTWAPTSARRTRSIDGVVHKMLAFVRMNDGKELHLEHLCQAAGMRERSLLRAFHRFFGVGPTQYLKLRRLNRVHSALMALDRQGMTLTSVLSKYGVTEFGRFAVTYKMLFGESPSETLRQQTARTMDNIREHDGPPHAGI